MPDSDGRPPDDTRIGDAERDRVIEELRTHTAGADSPSASSRAVLTLSLRLGPSLTSFG